MRARRHIAFAYPLLLALLCSCRPCSPVTPCSEDSDCPRGYTCNVGYAYCHARPDAGITSSAGVSGIYRDIALEAGQSLVLRAVGHSDGAGLPFVALLDSRDEHEITSLVGSTTSTRDAPDVLLLTAEVPEDGASIRVVLGSAGEGTVSWHQVELLPNLVHNPSFERLSSLDGVSGLFPSDWDHFDPVDVTEERGRVRSGRRAARLIGSAEFTELCQDLEEMEDHRFYAVGGHFWHFVGDLPGIAVHNGSLFRQTRSFPSESKFGAGIASATGTWQHASGVGRSLQDTQFNNWNDIVCWGGNHNNDTNTAVDDAYALVLPPLTVTPQPADETESSLNDFLRVDGHDLATQEARFLPASSGSLEVRLGISALVGQAQWRCSDQTDLLGSSSAAGSTARSPWSRRAPRTGSTSTAGMRPPASPAGCSRGPSSWSG